MALQDYRIYVLLAALLMLESTFSIAEQGDISEIRLNLRTLIDDTSQKLHGVPLQSEQRVTVIERRKVPGPFPRQRHPELSSNHLLVIGSDKNGQEIIRLVVVDPRLIRAEIFDPDGNITTVKEIYQPSVEFSIVLPDDPRIALLKFYHPKKMGNEFDLELIAATQLF